MRSDGLEPRTSKASKQTLWRTGRHDKQPEPEDAMYDFRFNRWIGAAALLAATSLPATADPSSTPNGPWVTPNQTISLEAFSTYEELTDRLMRIEASSKGLVDIESIGLTGEGRDIWLAKIGNSSNLPVLIFTQQHGDEPHGTESALDLIRFLGTGSQAARRILDELYVLVIPRVNPDGAEIPTRGNVDFDAEPRDTGQCPAAGGSDLDGRGIFSTGFQNTGEFSYDINRYHWPVWEDSWQYLCNFDAGGGPLYPVNPVPEALAVLNTFAEYLPVWALDVHNQGFNVIDPDECGVEDACRPGQYVTGSILWPTNPDVAPGTVDLSKQMALVMKKRSMEIGNVELTRYNGGSFAGIARNAYGLLGGGSVLFEVVGQIEGSAFINNGQKAIGKLNSGITKILVSLLEATADGSLYAEDPSEANTLILDNDNFLANPRLTEE
jgi:hypothetical protein